MEMSRDEHHDVPNPNGGWNVRRAGADRASVQTHTKQDAVDQGRKISQNQETLKKTLKKTAQSQTLWDFI
jgi:hypothetical protein